MSRTFSELLDWQWDRYAPSQRDWVNLLIHLFAVPMFWIGTLDALGALLFSGLLHALGALLLMALALFAQALGNAREKNPPEPYADGWDFARRAAAEQFVTFPRFLLSGGWWRNFRESA